MFPSIFGNGKKGERELLSERPQLSPDQFYKTYYSDQDINHEVIKIIYDLAEINFYFSLHGIKPDDRWIEDIFGNRVDDYLELSYFFDALEFVFGIEISDQDVIVYCLQTKNIMRLQKN